MQTMIYQERRKTPRFTFSALAILKTPDGPDVATAQILDLSLGGACVRVNLPVVADQEFLLVIPSDEGDIVVRGEVRYTRPGDIAGLSFLRLSEKAAGRLNRLVQELSELSQPPEST